MIVTILLWGAVAGVVHFVVIGISMETRLLTASPLRQRRKAQP